VKKYKDWTKDQWRKVVFSDESHFLAQGQKSQHIRRTPEEKIRDSHINQLVKHPQEKMFQGILKLLRCRKLSANEKNDVQYNDVQYIQYIPRYIEVVRKSVFPEMEKKHPDGSGIFQQGLAPCHASNGEDFRNREEDTDISLALEFYGLKPNWDFVGQLQKSNSWLFIVLWLFERCRDKAICSLSTIWFTENLLLLWPTLAKPAINFVSLFWKNWCNLLKPRAFLDNLAT